MDTIIAGGTIVTAGATYRADIGIVGERVVTIAERLEPGPGTTVLEATGKYVFPGGVDTHTHLGSTNQVRDPAEDFLSGTIAAACGGTTSIVDFAPHPRGGSLMDGIAAWHRSAEGKAVIDYGFHSIVIEATPAVLDELLTLPEAGITSFKLFLAYKGRTMVDDRTLVEVLDRGRRAGALTLIHAEHGEIIDFLQRRLIAEGKTAPKYHAVSRPPRVEAEATGRAIALAEVLGAPVYIVHVSCAEALDEVVRGRARGAMVLAETCPQYLYTTEADLDRPEFEGAKYVFTPPPRTADQQRVLWHALATGALQAVNSDHSAHHFATHKALGRDDFTKIPNGGPGIEERLMLVYQGVNAGRFSPNRFVELVSTAPARMFGLYPRKGTIAVGSDADLVIWDPDAELTITRPALHHAVDYTLYEGLRVRGVPQTVLRRGEVIVRDRQFVGRPGTGRFLHRQRFDPTAL